MNQTIKNKTKTFFFALGGLGEVGKNTYCVEHDDSIIIIDAGVMFGDEYLPGVNYIVPDYTYLVENQEKIKALIITHGHEDHIGGIPFLLKNVSIPFIYAPKLAASFIKNKLQENKITSETKILEIDSKSELKIGPFKLSFYDTTHSIPDSLGIEIDTPNGNIVNTGDFKIDLTPVGNDIDLHKIARIGEKKVTLLLSDSTNIEVSGLTISESKVIESIHDVFKNAPGRLIIGTFASNVHRIQQIAEAALIFKRKILVLGRSMEKTILMGRKLGYINVPDSYFISPEMAKYLNPEELLIFSTGTQGEAMAALTRIASGQHKHISIMPGDTVVLSSSSIPGNTYAINKVVNALSRAGASVVTNSVISNIHASGHASRDELKLMLKLLKPDYFCPVHGEYRMLKLHAELAQDLGIAKENTFVLANGDVLVLDKGKVSKAKSRVQADDIYVDGNDINGLSTAVIKDRKILSDEGLVAALITIDAKNNTLLTKPSILSRGFIYIKENADLVIQAENLIYNTLNELFLKEKVTFGEIKNTIRNTLSTFLFTKTRRNPMIIPVIMNLRDDEFDDFNFIARNLKK